MEKLQWKKDVLPPQKGNLGIISAVMPQFSKLSLPVLGKKLKTKKKYQFILSFPLLLFQPNLIA